MQITITINCDNAAFEDNGMEMEAARIIRKAAQLVETEAVEAALRDSNGNTVGKMEVTP